jgi:hypothetical protein
MVILCSLLGWISAPCFGQHTVVRDAGGGRKLELVYDASGQVVETRTVDQAGRLQVRVEQEYRPGFYVPQEIITSYGPDGKAIRRVSRENYDENANFTQEVITVFDESGKQTGGHTLTHDPFTGIYHCARWNAAAQQYQTEKCPAGEREGPEAGELKELTQAEAAKQVALARQARREEEKARRIERLTPIQPPITTVMKEVGVVLPAALRPGERVSGSVVEDPEKYEGIEDLKLVRMELPFESQGAAATLGGWIFEVAGESPQRADGPVAFTVPRGASEFSVTLRQVGNPAHSVSRPVSVAEASPVEKPQSSRAFETSPLCLKGDFCRVRGRFSGDSAKTLIAFGSRPARIVAETEDAAYIGVPELQPTGMTHLIVAEGSLVAALPVVVGELSFSPGSRDLHEGQTLLIHLTLSGPEDLPDQQWQAGTFPPGASLERARSLVPGFELPRKGSEGVILLVVRNATPEAISLRGSKNQTFAFELTPDSFERGEFRYKFVVEAAKSGGFALRGTVMPFLAPVGGQQFKKGVGSRQ